MVVRQMIKIDEDLCNGCGLCVNACHEAALAIVDGKAKILRDDYCDGLGNCLPVCPTGAITFVQREALPFNEEEVKRNMDKIKEEQVKEQRAMDTATTGGCPGSRAHVLQGEGKKVEPISGGCPGSRMKTMDRKEAESASMKENTSMDEKQQAPVSQLRQWPVQVQLVPVNAPYFSGADLLIAADCTAYSYGDFHRFMKDKITLIGCPKLDEVDYSKKLTDILSYNDLNSITVIRMNVPCCGGIVQAVQTALRDSGKMIPWRVITISTEGVVLDDRG